MNQFKLLTNKQQDNNNKVVVAHTHTHKYDRSGQRHWISFVGKKKKKGNRNQSRGTSLGKDISAPNDINSKSEQQKDNDRKNGD